MKVEVNIMGINITLGQCKSAIDGTDTTPFCFVNEDSPCSKNQTQFRSLPGTYYSTEPCKGRKGGTRYGWITVIGFALGFLG